MADTYTYNIDVFKAVIGLMFDVNAPENQGWISELFNTGKTYADQNIDMALIPDIVLTKGTVPKFNERFSAMTAANERARARGEQIPFTNISDYVATEKDFAKSISKYEGFKEFSSINNIKEFINKDLSVDEVTGRIDNAFYAVRNADQALKDELRSMFPAASDADFANALITGSTSSLEGKQKIAQAGISVETKAAGINLQSNIEDLAKRGITREDAAKAAKQIAAEQTGLRQAARTFGGQIQDVQLQAEQEAFGVKSSNELKRLRSQSRAEFAGGTGIQTGSLRKKKNSSSQL